MRILIVEDELLIAEMLKEMLKDLGHSICGIAKNYAQAQFIIEHEGTALDLCFLDINLQQEQSGFDVALLLQQKGNIPFIFLTSYSDKETITQAMKFGPEAYLIKPFTEIDLFTTLAVIQGRKSIASESQENAHDFVIIKDGTQKIKLAIADIIWLRSESVYVEINTPHKVHLIRTSLVRIMEEWKLQNIVRVHRTYAVNINHVKAISGGFLYIQSEKIPLSRKYKDEINELF